MRAQRELTAEERQAVKSGRVVYVRTVDGDGLPLTPEERAQKLAAARAQMGPGGQVIQLEWADLWEEVS